MKIKNNTNKLIELSSLIFKSLNEDPVQELYHTCNDNLSGLIFRNRSKKKFCLQYNGNYLVEMYSGDTGEPFDSGIFISSNWKSIDCQIGNHKDPSLKTTIFGSDHTRITIDFNLLVISDNEYFQYSTVHNLPPREFIEEFKEYYDCIPSHLNGIYVTILKYDVNYKVLKEFLLSDNAKDYLNKLYKFNYNEYESIVKSIEE